MPNQIDHYGNELIDYYGFALPRAFVLMQLQSAEVSPCAIAQFLAMSRPLTKVQAEKMDGMPQFQLLNEGFFEEPEP